jgi:acyl carrier protein
VNLARSSNPRRPRPQPTESLGIADAREFRVHALVAARLGVRPEEISVRSSLVDELGLDRWDVFELIETLEEDFGVKLDDATPERLPSISELVKALRRALASVGHSMSMQPVPPSRRPRARHRSPRGGNPMHEVGERLFHEALSVMNRALESGANPSELFPGASQTDIQVAVLGANPDEDQGVLLRIEGKELRIAGRFDPHAREHPPAFSIRLDDVERIASKPDHFAAAPGAIARLIAAA